MRKTLIILFIVVFLAGCSATEDFTVMHQVTGAISTNCYLIYGGESKEAALVDVAGPVDDLIAHIEQNDLKLKYILCTHGHFDHIIGVPEIKKRFSDAQVVLNEKDYRDMFSQKEWMERNFGQEFIEYMLSDPERKKLHDFDVRSFGEPDIFIANDQVLPFGRSSIRAVHSPGHSPGSTCFVIDDILFSGDVLFYRSVGRTDIQNSSPEDQIKSVKRLYEMYADGTKVYPGHKQFTDIGSEKRENKSIRPQTEENSWAMARRITWLKSSHPYGHAGLKMDIKGKVIYLDPVDLEAVSRLPKADVILVTHHHEDHFSPQTIRALSQSGTIIVSIGQQAAKEAVIDATVISLDPGKLANINGIEITGISAYGSAGHAREMNGLGFILSFDGLRIYCSGDTGLTPEMESFSGIDIAVLNVRKPYALSGEEVVSFAEKVKPGTIIPIHWMPDNDSYGDGEQIEYIKRNIPGDIRLKILNLK